MIEHHLYRIGIWLLVFVLSWMPLHRVAFTAEPQKTANDFKELVERHVNPFLNNFRPPGVVVGIITPDGTRLFFPYGKTSSEGKSPDADTVFEIGSVTKTFTALLFADLVVRGELELESPVQTLLPEAYLVPKRGTAEITLLELATHTSGLPRIPPNLIRDLVANPELGRNPYRQFDTRKLEEGLTEIELQSNQDPAASYSNLGMGLLGEAICYRSGKTYDQLIRERIAGPLGMPRTSATPPNENLANRSVGHAGNNKPVPYWEYGSLMGCGAVCSTPDDMLTYLEAQSGRKETVLSEAMKLSQVPRETFMVFSQIGMGWIVLKYFDGKQFWWHNGGTNGFTAYAAFCREPAVAVVLLCNHGPDGFKGLLRMETDIVGERILKDLISSAEK